MKYDPKTFSYGAEHEWGDVLYGQPLPEGYSWNNKDNTVMNSNGVANDPKGELWPYGGEINSRPTPTTYAQLLDFVVLLSMLDPKPVVNFRSNLHIHIRVPGLKDDLEAVKHIQRYIDRYGQEAFDIVEKIPKPDKSQMTAEAYEGAMKRYKRRKVSHQHMLPKARLDEMYAATTIKEFFEAHAPIGKDNLRMWYFSPRAGINLRQLWEETETIEFRHFPGTIDPKEFASCLKWCHFFMIHALSEEQLSPMEWSADMDFIFPKFEPYDYELDKIFKMTNFSDNNRTQVKENLEKLKAEGRI